MKSTLSTIFRSLESKLLAFCLKTVISAEENSKNEMECISSDLVYITSQGDGSAKEIHIGCYDDSTVILLDAVLEVKILNKRVTIHTYNVKYKHVFVMKTHEDATALYKSLSRRIEEYKNPTSFDVDNVVNNLLNVQDSVDGFRLFFPIK
jgi:hypothetical protein